MDMKTLSGNLSAAKLILSEMSNPSVSLYGFMIKAFGEADKIDDSIYVFHTMLNDQRVIPNIYAFNMLLNACALSKSYGYLAFDRASELVDLLGTNERCVQLRFRPDKVTYNTLLKCLMKSSTCKEGASALAEEILHEMEERQKSDGQIKPNLITFNFAITICLLSNDQERMDAFLNKMKQHNLRADARLCNTILNYYAQTGTSESAERAESFLSNIKRMSQTDKSVRPNVYTYNILLNAWGRSNDPNFAHRMWYIYESMLSDQIIPDGVTYHTMLSHLTKSPNNIGMADKLLVESESSNTCNDDRYEPDYELYEMLIKAYLKFLDAENATQVLIRWLHLAPKKRTIPEKRSRILGSMAPLYHQLAQVWIQLGDLERATTVTEQICELYLGDIKKQKATAEFVGCTTEPPSVHTLALLHKIWNRSRHQSKDMYLNKIKARISSFQQ